MLPMSPEIADTIQAWMSVFQTGLIIFSLLFAVYESRKWRTQVIGNKKIDLAHQISERVGITYEKLEMARYCTQWLIKDENRTKEYIEHSRNAQNEVRASLTQLHVLMATLPLYIDTTTQDIGEAGTFAEGYNQLRDVSFKLADLRGKLSEGHSLDKDEKAFLCDDSDKNGYVKTVSAGMGTLLKTAVKLSQ
jgi:hypothetical protein